MIEQIPTNLDGFDRNLSLSLDWVIAEEERCQAKADRYTQRARQARLARQELERLQAWLELGGSAEVIDDDQDA